VIVLKIFVIGPIYPFRGGIAHSNLRLCTNLAKNHEVIAISFKRMFPLLLYPGKDQYEPIVEDKNFPFERIFLIDTLNPISWLSAVSLIGKKKPNILIFQWWHTFFVPAYWVIAFLAKLFLLKNNFKIGIICQNVLPHEGNKIHNFLSKLFFKQANYFITLSSSDKKLLQGILPNSRVDFIIEPLYDLNLKNKNINKNEAKIKLCLDKKDKILLFFGFVRPYKGLIYLIRAMPSIIKKMPEIKLLVIGEWWENKQEYAEEIQRLGIEKSVFILDKYAPNEDLPLYFRASDAVVLPYLSSTESGIIQLAFEFNTPIITTNVGGNVDLVEDKKTGLLVEPKDSMSLSGAILDYYEKNMEEKLKKEMMKRSELFKLTKKKEDIILNTKS